MYKLIDILNKFLFHANIIMITIIIPLAAQQFAAGH